jgi:hypothetical protein
MLIQLIPQSWVSIVPDWVHDHILARVVHVLIVHWIVIGCVKDRCVVAGSARGWVAPVRFSRKSCFKLNMFTIGRILWNGYVIHFHHQELIWGRILSISYFVHGFFEIELFEVHIMTTLPLQHPASRCFTYILWHFIVFREICNCCF